MADHPAPPSDPSPDQWLTPERLDLVQRELGASSLVLRLAGLHTTALTYWVRLQLAAEMEPSPDWPLQEREEELDQLEEAWLAKHNLETFGLDPSQLRQKLLVAPACSRWARKQWQHRLESLYLERKDQLDRASCRLIRLSDKHLALEIFHRLRANEQSFEALSLAHGEGPEKSQGGLLPLQPLSKLPYGLAQVVANLKQGGLTPPIKLGKSHAIVQLEQFEPAQLDIAMEDFLLGQELRAWVLSVVERLRGHIALVTSSQPAEH